MKKIISRFPQLRKHDGSVVRKGHVVLSLGLAIYLSWWLAIIIPEFLPAMFPNKSQTDYVSDNWVFAIITQSFQAIMLAFMASTDQRLLRVYSSRGMLVCASAVTALGTLAAMVFGAFGISFMGCCFIHALIGIGSAVLLVFWGIAYSRQNFRSILACTFVAIFLTFIILYILLALPEVPRMVLLGLIPVFDLAFLWSCSPLHYAIRRSIPIFNPLPVNALFFSLRLAVPAIFLGVVWGMFLDLSVTQFLAEGNYVDLAFATILAGLVIILALLAILLSISGPSWDYLLRITTIGVMACVPVLLLTEYTSPWILIPAIVGCMLLFIISWGFCSYISQNFRISPILIFSVVFFGITIGIIANNFFAEPTILPHIQLPVDAAMKCVAALVCLTLVEVLLPRDRDIKRTVISYQEPGSTNTVAQLNQQIQNIINAKADKDVAENPDKDKTGESLVGYHVETTAQEATRTDGDDALKNQDNPFYPIDEENERTRPIGRFRLRCEEIADAYMLSGRETEIMFLLAKGYPTSRITEELFISKNTAKTHTAHIYRKLRIHSRQELQKLIDSGEKMPRQP